ncbi:MAG: ABC transporter ATP-binding protein [Pseudaminobacter sp.]
MSVTDLTIDFPTSHGAVRAVDGISLDLLPGTTIGIVGESGSGKSVTALSIMGLLQASRVRQEGRVAFDGMEVRQLGDSGYPGLRGREMAMIFQDAASSLNPVLDIVSQVAEVYQVHLAMPPRKARLAATAMLERVGIADIGRGRRYPHHYSGGMRQRAVIAMALASNPRLLLADEPTTALDVTVQAQILDLLRTLIAEYNTTLVLISHDLGVVAGMTQQIGVMYAGRIVETAPTDQLFANPLHPYTLGLMRCIPRLDQPRPERLIAIDGHAPSSAPHKPGCAFATRCVWATERCHNHTPPLAVVAPNRRAACWHWQALQHMDGREPPPPLRTVVGKHALPATPLLVAENLRVDYAVPGSARLLSAVDDVSIAIQRGETLGLVGESGCGKSSLGRALLMLTRPTAGRVIIAGHDWTTASRAQLRAMRPRAQMIFQDPFETLDPRMTIGASISQAIRHNRPALTRAAITEKVISLLQTVQLPPQIAARLPSECSGGQLQRVAIARALSVSPELIVLDEPTSSLDVSIQAQVINLLGDLQERLGLTYLFISHNLAVVRQVATRVAVMYMGKIIELADRDQLFETPMHPYTQALIAAVPVPDPARERDRRRARLGGDVPRTAPSQGCRFHPRCPSAMDICRTHSPTLSDHADHFVACHLHQARRSR